MSSSPSDLAPPAQGRSAYRLAWARGLAAAGLVGLAGRLATPPALVLAIVAFFSFFDLGRREGAEAHPERDWTAWGMQASFLLILVAGAWQNRSPEMSPAIPGPVELGGILLIGAGLWLRRSVAQTMGAWFKVKIQVDDDQPLLREGPFRHVRHPSYLSLLLVAVGTTLSVRSPLAGLVTTFAWLPVTLIHIQREENTLARTFGARWDEYRAGTWRLVPWLF